MSSSVASWPTYKFPRRQERWSSIPISWRIFYSLLWSTQSKAEVDVLLELSFFSYDPTDVGNLIFGSAAFSKSSLNIWEFLFMYCWSLAWRILSITLLAWEMSAIVWQFEHSLSLPFGIGMETDHFWAVLWPLLSFPNLLTYGVQHFSCIIF